jgi:hypothetical protein
VSRSFCALVLGLLRWQPQHSGPCRHIRWQLAGIEAQNCPYGAARLATAMAAAYLWRGLWLRQALVCCAAA